MQDYNYRSFGQPQSIRTSFGSYNPDTDIFTMGERTITPDSIDESITYVSGGYLPNPTIEHDAMDVLQGLRNAGLLELIPTDLYQELMDAVWQRKNIPDEWLSRVSQFVNIPPNFLG